MTPLQLYCPRCHTPHTPQDTCCPTCGYRFLYQPATATGQTIALAGQQVGQHSASYLPFQPGQLLGGRYCIDQHLGAGGFGATYRAVDISLNDRPCVVKQLTIDPGWSDQEEQDARANFQREAQMLVDLNQPGHPNIPDIYAYLDSEACLVMKYIAGQSLEAVRRHRGGRLPVPEALKYIRDICDALTYMHGHGSGPVLHRDIKPDNIMLGTDGRVWLIDFGLSKSTAVHPGRAHPAATRATGTIGYTPAEQWQQQAEPRSDVYALAATLHTLLTGYQPPWTITDIPDIVQGHKGEFPPARKIHAAVSIEIESIIQRSMSTSVQTRPTARAFLQAIDALLQPQRNIQAPDGTILKDEQEMARWCEQHWQQAADWIYDRDTLPIQIEQQWGKNKLAQDLRAIKQQHRDNQDAGVDAAIALLDQSGFGAERPTFQVDKQAIDFGHLPVGATGNTRVKLVNTGRRYTHVNVQQLPGWLSIDHALLSLRPGQSHTITFTADMAQSSVGGAMQATSAFTNGSMTRSIPVHATVSRWRTVLKNALAILAPIVGVTVVVSMIVIGVILAGNAETEIAEYHIQEDKVAPMANEIGAGIVGLIGAIACLIGSSSERKAHERLTIAVVGGIASWVVVGLGFGVSYIFGWLITIFARSSYIVGNISVFRICGGAIGLTIGLFIPLVIVAILGNGNNKNPN
jgi:serine/threonine protein kinase